MNENVMEISETKENDGNSEHSNIFYRTYSCAEALQCHDFDLSNIKADNKYTTSEQRPARKSKYHPWKTLKPVRRKKRNNYLPLEDVGLWSFLWYTWLTPLVTKAYKQGLNMNDVWKCTERDSAAFNSLRLQKMWKEEIEKKGEEKASLATVCLKFSWKQLSLSALCQILFVCGSFAEVLIIHDLLQYIQGSESDLTFDLTHALILTCLLLITQTDKNLSISCQWTFGFHVGMQLRSAILAAIYSKVLSLRNLQDQTVGQVINMCANDGQRIFDAGANAAYLVGGPTILILSIFYTTYIMGPTALIGSLFFLLAYPTQILASKVVAKFRVRAIKVTDRRVRMVNEMVTSVKLIKMYAWEKPFSQKIAGIRNEERKVLQKSGFVQGLSQSINPMIQVLAVLSTFTIHIALGYELTPATAYAVVGMFAQARFALLTCPRAMKAVAECLVGIGRMKKFLLMEELQPYRNKPVDSSIAIEISNANFAWDTQEEKPVDVIHNEQQQMLPNKQLNFKDDSEKFVKTLFDINLNLKKGQLVGICGSVGSGKSSLLSAILAQMHLLSGQVAIDGCIAYVSQQAWIFNATLRENILFGQSFDEKLYETVVSASCLNRDIKELPFGDKTEIGERGINLSGGQKQRVSLARALYASRDIYLLDDPLSAVDVQVGKHLYSQYIKGALHGKCVIFVTHQLQYLDGCDLILVMEDGKIKEQGTHKQLMANRGQYADVVESFYNKLDHASNAPIGNDNIMSCKNAQFRIRSNTFHGVSDHAVDSTIYHFGSAGNVSHHEDISKTIERHISHTSSTSSVSDENEDVPMSSDKLISAEEIKAGEVTRKTYHCYIQHSGGYLLALVTLVLFVLSVGSTAMSVWWLGYWIAEGTQAVVINGTNTTDTSANVNLLEDTNASYFVTVFVILFISMVIFTISKCFLYVKVTQKAASNLHDDLFTQVFRSPMAFFDTTPSGRILNRFSKDIDEIDVQLPATMEVLLNFSLNILFILISIAIVFPWFLLAFIPFGFVLTIAGRYFQAALSDMKRLENVTRSPWFSQITATIQGLPTIHAYNKKEQFFQEFTEQLDVNAVANFVFNVLHRWLAVRLNYISAISLFATALFVVLTRGTTSASYAGVALTSAIQLSGIFQLVIRLKTELEARFTSVERLQYYIKNLPSEAPGVIQGQRPPEGWPKDGKVHVEKLKMFYRNDLPPVLKEITFSVQPMEKIGIVGRTGAGKSSLCLSIFRMMEAASGTISIDGIDISTIGLEDLRSKLSIIPQDPVLFVGTIRYNLDPFDYYSDYEIWNALDQCHLKERVTRLEGNLAAAVVENGENFSVGERQLLCMARALLRNSKILMLDEATASIDTETDSLIQLTIRDVFKDCTMLIIAHRLNTVLNCDRILVMDSGKVVEFERPSVLLKNANSLFSSMMSAATESKEYS